LSPGGTVQRRPPPVEAGAKARQVTVAGDTVVCYIDGPHGSFDRRRDRRQLDLGWPRRPGVGVVSGTASPTLGEFSVRDSGILGGPVVIAG
jgi:hypothetical protein